MDNSITPSHNQTELQGQIDEQVTIMQGTGTEEVKAQARIDYVYLHSFYNLLFESRPYHMESPFADDRLPQTLPQPNDRTWIV